MTKCQKLKSEADEKTAGGNVGHFTPACEADGTFAAVQCWGSTGYCWCALPDGTEVDGTRTRERDSLQECDIPVRNGQCDTKQN